MTGSRYGGRHQSLRKASLPFAFGQPCCRCGRAMLPGQSLDLDHADDGVTYRGFAHSKCNRRAGAVRGNRMRGVQRNSRREKVRKMVKEICLGLEISEDRQHTSICAAGRADGDLIVVELVAYIDGTDPVVEVLRLYRERIVLAVALDPGSPGATLCKLLRNAGISFTEMTSHDVAVSHGGFIDLLGEGRLKVVPDARLTQAVKQGQDRRLGGASAWERRGAAVDVSPANAAEFAVWAVLNASAPFFGTRR
jgi:hypothetical protein